MPSRWLSASTACSRISGRHRSLKPHYRLIGAWMENPNTSPGRDLLAGLGELFNDERAAGVVARLLVGLLDHLNLHHWKSPQLRKGWSTKPLAQVLDRDVNEPGAQRALLLVRFFPFVLHGPSPSL